MAAILPRPQCVKRHAWHPNHWPLQCGRNDVDDEKRLHIIDSISLKSNFAYIVKMLFNTQWRLLRTFNERSRSHGHYLVVSKKWLAFGIKRLPWTHNWIFHDKPRFQTDSHLIINLLIFPWDGCWSVSHKDQRWIYLRSEAWPNADSWGPFY